MRLGATALFCLAVSVMGCASAGTPPATPSAGYGPEYRRATSGSIERLPPAEMVPPGALVPSSELAVERSPTTPPAPTCNSFFARLLRKLDACGLSRKPPNYKPAPLGANEG